MRTEDKRKMHERTAIIKEIVRRLKSADWKTLWFIFYYLEG